MGKLELIGQYHEEIFWGGLNCKWSVVYMSLCHIKTLNFTRMTDEFYCMSNLTQ